MGLAWERNPVGSLLERVWRMAGSVFRAPEWVGDSSFTIEIKAGQLAAGRSTVARSAAEAIRGATIAGVVDIVLSPGRVTVAYDPLEIADCEAFRASVVAAANAADTDAATGGAIHHIPVAYDGADIDEVCSLHGIDRRRFMAAHTEPDYLVEAIGFLPGFGYLTGLPARLATPRRNTPRLRVPAGAVGIGGGQTGVYPFASPGGWNLVGRTDARLFDPARPRPSLLQVGDRVRFVQADLPPTVAADAEPLVSRTSKHHAAITVLAPGLFTTVQDLGRPGYRASGVPLSGAADPVSLRLANLLVGNVETAAALECTLLGPTLRFEQDAVIAIVGSPFPGFQTGQATRVAAGTVVALGHATQGCRGYFAIAGGIDVEPVLGSRSTLVAAGLGGLAGRPLAKGDVLAVGDMATRAPRRQPLVAARGLSVGRDRPGQLRVIPGEGAVFFGGDAWSRAYRTSSRSDRMGMRLDGEPLPVPADAGGRLSVAVFPGTVQVPPDGRPILLLADAQTIGGYPILGHVITADLPVAAQLRPGDEVCWKPVSLDEAHQALREREAMIAAIRETGA
jgi:KipI family sensor histidine kinase inhibitor